MAVMMSSFSLFDPQVAFSIFNAEKRFILYLSGSIRIRSQENINLEINQFCGAKLKIKFFLKFRLQTRNKIARF